MAVGRAWAPVCLRVGQVYPCDHMNPFTDSVTHHKLPNTPSELGTKVWLFKASVGIPQLCDLGQVSWPLCRDNVSALFSEQRLPVVSSAGLSMIVHRGQMGTLRSSRVIPPGGSHFRGRQ